MPTVTGSASEGEERKQASQHSQERFTFVLSTEADGEINQRLRLGQVQLVASCSLIRKVYLYDEVKRYVLACLRYGACL